MFAELLLTVAVALIAYAFYIWATINNEYFNRRGLKFVKPTLLLGETGKMFLSKITAVDLAKKVYDRFPKEPIYGMFDFRSPVYVLRDPEVVKQIAVKDFDFFENHQSFISEQFDRLWGNSLLLLKGEKWRDMRATLSPAFTGSKMRQMFVLVSECAENYVKYFLDEAQNGKKVNIEMKDTFARYTTDVIASCAFGIRVNSIADPKNEFFRNGKKLTDFNNLKSILKLILMNQLPKVAETMKLQFSDAKVSSLFKSMILDTMDTRRNNKILRPDMINLLMQAREGNLKQQTEERSDEASEGFATVEESEVGKKSVNREWNDDEIVAQCFLFFIGGFDTTSTMLMLTAYELVVNADIQQKLYDEIAETNERIGGKRITYDVLQKMKYLDQVVCEVLRLWPPFVQMDRECSKDYVYDDGDKLKFTIEKGRQVLIPIYGILHDPKYFNDPNRFDPERFSEENKHNIVPGTYIPFGQGPRNCIGSRFALMEVKAILYHLLLNFTFEANEKTDIPIKFLKNPFNLSTENGMNIELKPRGK